jgi:uncharacterized membrane protein YjjB (DUF3815 family)
MDIDALPRSCNQASIRDFPMAMIMTLAGYVVTWARKALANLSVESFMAALLATVASNVWSRKGSTSRPYHACSGLFSSW